MEMMCEWCGLNDGETGEEVNDRHSFCRFAVGMDDKVPDSMPLCEGK